MDHHLRVLEQRIKAVAIAGNDALIERKGRRGKVQDGQEEDLDSRHNRPGIGVEFYVVFVRQPQDESIRSEQPGPQQQRALLAAPQRGELIGGGQGAVGVLHYVSD